MILVVFKQTKDSLAFDPSMFIRKLSTDCAAIQEDD